MMILHRLFRLSHREQGFTLLELVIGIAIGGLISLAVGSLMVMMFKVNAGSLSRSNAIRQVQNVGLWVSEDVQSAQNITIGGAHVLEVTWSDWDGTMYKVDYDYDTVITSELFRMYYSTTTGVFPANPTSIMMVGQFINHAGTSIAKSAGMYNLTVTATVAGLSANGQPVTETRIYKIVARPGM